MSWETSEILVLKVKATGHGQKLRSNWILSRNILAAGDGTTNMTNIMHLTRPSFCSAKIFPANYLGFVSSLRHHADTSWDLAALRAARIILEESIPARRIPDRWRRHGVILQYGCGASALCNVRFLSTWSGTACWVSLQMPSPGDELVGLERKLGLGW
jgi:hypothetical protein